MSKKYEEYLLSEEWNIRSELRKELDNYSCAICGIPKHLNVHHRSYKNKYREKLADLITLCKDCHALYHNTLNQRIEMACSIDDNIKDEKIKLVNKKEKISEILKLNDDVHASIVTVKDKTDFRKVIDKCDDERRENYRKSEDVLLEMISTRIEEIGDSELIHLIFKYKNLISINREKEDYFEELDDMDRESLMKFLYHKNEKYNQEKHKIEKMIVLGEMPKI